jgi:hypothetical protein
MDFATFKWTSAERYRSTFTADHVNTMLSGLGRHYHKPFRLTCITDDPRGISSEVRIVPLWDDWAQLPSPHGIGYPSCYRRLKLFSKEAEQIVGPYFACLDLDMVFTGDVTPLFDPDVDFKIWGDTARQTPYNGSMMKMRAGARRQVWETFDPVTSPRRSLSLGYVGSDQGWIGACLGPHEAKWTSRRDLPRGCGSVESLGPAHQLGPSPLPVTNELSIRQQDTTGDRVFASTRHVRAVRLTAGGIVRGGSSTAIYRRRRH